MQPLTVDEDFLEIRQFRLPGTSEWILNEKSYMEWVESEQSVLWLLGGPGAGKSVIAVQIIDVLSRRKEKMIDMVRVSKNALLDLDL